MSYENHKMYSYLVSSYSRLYLLAGILIIFITYTSFFKLLSYGNHKSYSVSSYGRRSLNAMPVLKSRLISTTYHTLTTASTILCKHWHNCQYVLLDIYLSKILRPLNCSLYANTGTIVNMSF